MFVRVCMICRPGMRSVAGVQVSHGLCSYHALEMLAKNNLATRGEIIELWLRRLWPYLVAAALLAMIVLCGVVKRNHGGLISLSRQFDSGPRTQFSGSVKSYARASVMPADGRAIEDLVKVQTPETV